MTAVMVCLSTFIAVAGLLGLFRYLITENDVFDDSELDEYQQLMAAQKLEQRRATILAEVQIRRYSQAEEETKT